MTASTSSPSPAAPIMHEPTVASSSRDAPDETEPAPAPTLNTNETTTPAQIPSHAQNGARAPFQPQPMQMAPFKPPDSIEAQRLAHKPFSAKWANAKNWMNFALLNINTVVIILSAYLNTDSSAGYSFGIMIVSWICLGVCSLSIIWTASELLVLMYRGQRNPIHPGAHVGTHLILWMLAIFATGVLTTYWVVGFFEDSYSSYLSDITPETTLTTADLGRLGTDDLMVLIMRRRATRIGRTLAIAMWAIMITHFILFVRACVETNQLRRFNRVVYIIQQPMQQQPMPMMTGAQVQVPVHTVPENEKQQTAVDPMLHGYYAPTAVQPPYTVGHAV